MLSYPPDCRPPGSTWMRTAASLPTLPICRLLSYLGVVTAAPPVALPGRQANAIGADCRRRRRVGEARQRTQEWDGTEGEDAAVPADQPVADRASSGRPWPRWACAAGCRLRSQRSGHRRRTRPRRRRPASSRRLPGRRRSPTPARPGRDRPRSVEDGVAEGEHPAITGRQPVAATIRRRGHGHHGPAEMDRGGVAVPPRRAERRDLASGGDEPVAEAVRVAAMATTGASGCGRASRGKGALKLEEHSRCW